MDTIACILKNLRRGGFRTAPVKLRDGTIGKVQKGSVKLTDPFCCVYGAGAPGTSNCNSK